MIYSSLVCACAKVLQFSHIIGGPAKDPFFEKEDTGNGISTGSASNTATSPGSIKNISDLTNTVVTIMKSVLGPILTVLGLGAVFLIIYLGVMYAKAEDANKRKEIQGRLIGACIGGVIIVVGATLCFAIAWPQAVHKVMENGGSGHAWVDSNADGLCDTCNPSK